MCDFVSYFSHSYHLFPTKAWSNKNLTIRSILKLLCNYYIALWLLVYCLHNISCSIWIMDFSLHPYDESKCNIYYSVYIGSYIRACGDQTLTEEADHVIDESWVDKSFSFFLVSLRSSLAYFVQAPSYSIMLEWDRRRETAKSNLQSPG